jgi:Flp pilus assembly protein TadG
MPLRNRSGAVLVIFAASLMTFISFMALVIDVGYLYALKARIQSVCDSAAIATIAGLDSKRPLGEQQRFAVALTRRLLEINGLQVHNYEVRLQPGYARGGVARLEIAGREVLNAFFAQAVARQGFVVGVYTDATAIQDPDGSLRAILQD